LREHVWEPSDFGLEPSGREPLLVDGPEESAAIIRDVLAGKLGPARDIVVANAAAALWTVGRADSLWQCARAAEEAIDSGAARDLLAQLVVRTNRLQ
jgi:anthranilate phosphoribosyltransferase